LLNRLRLAENIRQAAEDQEKQMQARTENHRQLQRSLEQSWADLLQRHQCGNEQSRQANQRRPHPRTPQQTNRCARRDRRCQAQGQRNGPELFVERRSLDRLDFANGSSPPGGAHLRNFLLLKHSRIFLDANLLQQVEQCRHSLPIGSPIGSNENGLRERVVRLSPPQNLFDLFERIELAVDEVLPVGIDVDHELLRLKHRRQRFIDARQVKLQFLFLVGNIAGHQKKNQQLKDNVNQWRQIDGRNG
jgi:hypothetical protein